MHDTRYTINLVWCGYPKQRYMLRFMGGWLGSYRTRRQAKRAAKAHSEGMLRLLHQRALDIIDQAVVTYTTGDDNA